MQAAVGVGLVLPFAHETERRRRRACSADGHSEAVVEQRVRDRLTAVCYASRASERIAVIELARCASPLAEAGSVDRRAVFQDRARRSCAVAEIVRSSGAVHLLHPHVVAIVGETVGRRAWIGNARYAVFVVIRERGDARAIPFNA